MFASLAHAQRVPPGTVVAGDLGRRLDAVVVDQAPSYWGCVLVAVQGQPVLAKGYGMLDRQKLPHAPASLFDLGGSAQQLTAILALRLLADKKLRLDEPVGKYLGDWPADKAAITVDHLLRHTSGLPPDASWAGGAANASRTAMQAIGRTKLVAPPGQAFHYSVLNSILLALALEEVTQQRFDKLLADRVLKPAGMATAGQCNARFDTKWVTFRRSAENERGEPATAHGQNWAHRGARGLLGSVLDVHELLGALSGGKLLDDERLDLLWRPLAGGDGYGVAVQELGATKLVRVNGQTTGYRARWLLHRASRSWVVLLTEDYGNLDGLEGALAAELAQHLLAAGAGPAAPAQAPATTPAPAPTPPPAPAPTAAASPAVPAAELDRFLGTFVLPQGGGWFRIERSRDGLQLHGEGLQASARLLEGVWPPANEARLRRAEDRGMALFDRLVADAPAIDREGFVSADDGAAARAMVRGWLQKQGPLVRLQFVGTRVAERAAESWFRVVAARGELLLRCAWSADERWQACAVADEAPPFVVPVVFVRADCAIADSLAGRQLSLSIEGVGSQRRLVFEDGSAGHDGLLECALAPMPPR